MINLPENLKYSNSHEWILLQDDNTVRVGITDFAQRELGDVVFIELPEPGRKVDAGEPCGTIESVKAASEIFSPVSGEIISVNDTLNDDPEQVNTDAYQAWFFCIKPANLSDLDQFMDAEAYRQSIEE